jgi:uncharacterized membrane protein YhaH (DUF805 family)
MSFQDAVRSVLTKYADFNGRARRSEYWYFVLFSFLVLVAAMIVGRAIGLGFLYYVAWLGLLLPSLAVGARRLHDTGRPGLWLLIGLVPLVGAIILLVFFVSEGNPGPNQYGPSPKDTAAFA